MSETHCDMYVLTADSFQQILRNFPSAGQNIRENLEKKMNEFASKLEFEDAARLRDEINRLKAKEVGLSNKVLQFKKN